MKTKFLKVFSLVLAVSLLVIAAGLISGALGNYSLKADSVSVELTGEATENKLEMFKKQLKWTGQVCDERFIVVFMRKMAAFYVKGMRGAAAYKERFFRAQTAEEILQIAEECFG